MPPSAQRRSAPVVLVIDDEVFVCRFMGRVLSEEGYRVLEAHDARQALATLVEHAGAINLVVSDVDLPHMTGEDLASVIAERWPAIPVLLVSGKPYTGPRAFLPKPFRPDALIAWARRIVSPGGSDVQKQGG